MTAKILVSACLMGHAVRYDGASKPLSHPAIDRWREEGRLVTICPEMSAGMPVPRPPAEIEHAQVGADVLSGNARVVERTGRDVTDEFVQAAENALALALDTGCRFALLIDGSPSCGSGFIYDGSFSGARHPGMGVTAALLRQNGIEVYSDSEIELLAAKAG
ncbi:DUF523 domain-containing protein [Sinorhizobium sp. 7-81]|uniref:DUF523 domain-containing protein n=1 Tax=Sinorhizobium sp. 8-89 TaxID=3049089 RepID=UPI0024C2E46E|nr:DUF523 domain-containing protein [Sinorhizobium sp. 8-89]MDK1488748.1 DUF523 domain-containing protein [Sinorhizobium sp. 8-89]